MRGLETIRALIVDAKRIQFQVLGADHERPAHGCTLVGANDKTPGKCGSISGFNGRYGTSVGMNSPESRQ
jgi:hypothetical protein